MKNKGKGFNKKIWFSYCSEHYEYSEKCRLCNIGHWENIWKHKIGEIIFKISPKFWIWWMNKIN